MISPPLTCIPSFLEILQVTHHIRVLSKRQEWTEHLCLCLHGIPSAQNQLLSLFARRAPSYSLWNCTMTPLPSSLTPIKSYSCPVFCTNPFKFGPYLATWAAGMSLCPSPPYFLQRESQKQLQNMPLCPSLTADVSCLALPRAHPKALPSSRGRVPPQLG